jgi:hypothetical protein
MGKGLKGGAAWIAGAVAPSAGVMVAPFITIQRRSLIGGLPSNSKLADVSVNVTLAQPFH